MKDNTFLILGLVAAAGAAVYFAMRNNGGGKAGPQSPAWGSGGAKGGSASSGGASSFNYNSQVAPKVITPETTPQEALEIKQAAKGIVPTSTTTSSDPQPISDATTQPVVTAPTGKKLQVEGLFGTHI